MFEQTFVEAVLPGKRGASMLISVLAELFGLCVLIALPVLYTHRLPQGVLKTFLVAPRAPRAASTPESQTATHPGKAEPRLFNIQNLVSRPAISVKRQSTIVSGPAPDIGVPGSSDAASDTGVNRIIGSGEAPDAPPPAPEPKKEANSSPLRVGGRTEEANLIHKVMPVYPQLAKSARVQGSVEFTALISKEGMIGSLRLVRGHPLLIEAAKEAVLQWRYRPTLLNGVPVEVVTDITVNFTLDK